MKTTLWKPKSISELAKDLNVMEEQNGHRFESLNHVTNQSDKRNIVTYRDDEEVGQLHSGDPKQDLSIQVVPKTANWEEFITPLVEEHDLLERTVVFVKGIVKPKLQQVVVLRRVTNPYDPAKGEGGEGMEEYMQRLAKARKQHTSLPA